MSLFAYFEVDLRGLRNESLAFEGFALNDLLPVNVLFVFFPGFLEVFFFEDR